MRHNQTSQASKRKWVSAPSTTFKCLRHRNNYAARAPRLTMRRRSGRKCIEMAKWFESARGGTESAREGTESAREGTESAREGIESAREGTESAREGTESARLSTESALVSLR